MRLQSEVGATQVLAGIVESFNVKSMAHIGSEGNEEVKFVSTHFPSVEVHPVRPDSGSPGASADLDLVFIGTGTDDGAVGGLIDAWLPRVKPGGLIAGEGYHHKAIGVHKALADRFSLLQVTVMPDGCWCYQK